MKSISIAFLLSMSFTVFSQTFPVESKVIFSNAVFFDFGKHNLRPEADSLLKQVFNALDPNGSNILRITAHTDSIGSIKNNLALSKRRSNSLRMALVEMGVPENKIEISNFGETTPSSTNATESGRQANRRATIDVLKFPPLTTIHGTVIEAESKAEITLKSMVVLHTKNWQDTIYTDSSGYFEKELPVGVVIGIDAYSDCHFFNSIMTKTTLKNDPIKIPLELVEKGKSLNLNNLYFVGDQAILLPKSEPELPKILRFMQSNPYMVIEIAGHINKPNEPKVAENTSHFRLSVNRAKMVHDYLLSNGISEERISFAGYGNWEMVFPKAISQKHQALNRRVELKVLEGGCE